MKKWLFILCEIFKVIVVFTGIWLMIGLTKKIAELIVLKMKRFGRWIKTKHEERKKKRENNKYKNCWKKMEERAE